MLTILIGILLYSLLMNYNRDHCIFGVCVLCELIVCNVLYLIHNTLLTVYNIISVWGPPCSCTCMHGNQSPNDTMIPISLIMHDHCVLSVNSLSVMHVEYQYNPIYKLFICTQSLYIHSN